MATIKQHFDTDQLQFRSGTAFPQFVKDEGTNGPVTGLAFDPTTEEVAFIRSRAINYGTGNLTITVNWYTTASSGGVTFGASIAAITPNTDTADVTTKAFSTETTFSDTHLGTTAKRSHDVAGTLSALDSLSTDDVFLVRLARKPADAGDTIAADVIVTTVDLSWSDT